MYLEDGQASFSVYVHQTEVMMIANNEERMKTNSNCLLVKNLLCCCCCSSNLDVSSVLLVSYE